VITMQLKYSPFWLNHNAGSEFGSNHDSHQLKEVLTRTTGDKSSGKERKQKYMRKGENMNDFF